MPLRYLFIDMNSFFASVEQQDDPRLRGRPVAVIPTEAETTVCIAASHEAKQFGVKTGKVELDLAALQGEKASAVKELTGGVGRHKRRRALRARRR